MPRVPRTTGKKASKQVTIPDDLEPLYMEDLKSLCRKHNLPDSGRRDTLCRRLKAVCSRQNRSKDEGEQSPDGTDKQSDLTWLNENQRAALTTLIRQSVQSAMGDAISQTAKKVLAVVKLSLSLPGTPGMANTDHHEHPANASQDLSDLGGEEQMEVHEPNPSMLEPCELTSNTQPRSKVDLAPKRNGNSNNSQHDEIMERLNELSTKLQNLGESSVGQHSEARINYFQLLNHNHANYHNPNPGVSAKVKQEIQSDGRIPYSCPPYRSLSTTTSRGLASQLDATLQRYMAASLAINSKKTYSSDEKRYIEFCQRLNIAPRSILPDDENRLTLFSTYMTSYVKTETIKVYFAAITYMHIINGYNLNLQSFLRLQYILKGIKRTQGESKRIRLPIILTHLKLFQLLLSSPSTNNEMLCAALTLAFSAFLRVSEFTCPETFNPKLHLSSKDITFFPHRVIQST